MRLMLEVHGWKRRSPADWQATINVDKDACAPNSSTTAFNSLWLMIVCIVDWTGDFFFQLFICYLCNGTYFKSLLQNHFDWERHCCVASAASIVVQFKCPPSTQISNRAATFEQWFCCFHAAKYVAPCRISFWKALDFYLYLSIYNCSSFVF